MWHTDSYYDVGIHKERIFENLIPKGVKTVKGILFINVILCG